MLDDGEGWMAMIKSRNQSSHTYNQSVAEAIAALVIERYFPLSLFKAFETQMRQIESANDS